MVEDGVLKAEPLTERAREYANPQMPAAYLREKAELEPDVDARFPLDPEELLRRAAAATGLDDFGDPTFREGLAILCRSGAGVGLNAMGQKDLHDTILAHLIQRLRLEDLWKRHPEILDEDIEAPVVVVGLTRSGTTFLYHLLSHNPAFRYPRYWEAYMPLPEHDLAIRPPDDGPLRDKVRQAIEFVHENAPRALAMHQADLEGPEEEIFLFGATLTSMVYAWHFRVPEFAEWLQRIDHEWAYRYLRRILQTLQWMRGGGRWLLKAVQHVGYLKPLMKVFPDANVVFAFRDPATATVSIANLCAYVERLRFDHPDPIGMGAAQVDLTIKQVRAFMRDRDLVERSADVHFRELMRDPVTQARRIHDLAGLPFTPEVERRISGFAEENRKVKHVKNIYAPEDFGIDVPALRAQLRDYYERFAIPVDEDL